MKTPQGPRRVGLLARGWRWLDDRTGLASLIQPLLRHVVPPRTGWMYVFGSATLFVFALQVLTGIALATAYVASTDDAFQSLRFITEQAFLGNLVRGMHYFGASAMVVLVGIHMARVFLTGSYKFPREVNWLTGVLLLALTLAMAFTGQLLRWDQNAVWSVVVGAEQAGRAPLVGDFLARFLLAGDVLGAATLSRFFAFHVFFIPALLFVFVAAHVYLVVRNGISERPTPGQPVQPRTYRAQYESLLQREGRPFWPHAAWRDVVFGVGVIAVVFSLAAVFGPPQLGKPPDPTIIDAYPHPDWYFLWYFAVLALIPHASEPYVMILGPAAAGAVLLALPFISNYGERSPRRRPWAVASVGLIVTMIATLTIAGVQARWSPDFNAEPLPPEVVGEVGGAAIHGADLFFDKGCEFCHAIEGHGGRRGPDLSDIADRLSAEQMTIRILSGRGNMPAFAGILAPEDLDDIISFLRTRSSRRASSDGDGG